MFSIVIPTWNNLSFVKMCVDSIRKNSAYEHQIILHINDGSDGTFDWAEDENIEFTRTLENEGICTAVNLASALANQEYLVYMNDDMYVCPGWDTEMMKTIESLGTDLFMISSTMIEPVDTGNPCVIVSDFGKEISSFDEERLLIEYLSSPKKDWNGSAWPPTIVHRKYWQIVGGYSIEFRPGMSSDDDFAMKMWLIGCRIFKGISKSRVYHFQAKSTKRVERNDGRRQFLMKWGINQSTFNRYYIKRGSPYSGKLPEPEESVIRKERLRAKVKQIFWK